MFRTTGTDRCIGCVVEYLVQMTEDPPRNWIFPYLNNALFSLSGISFFELHKPEVQQRQGCPRNRPSTLVMVCSSFAYDIDRTYSRLSHERVIEAG